MLPNKEKGMLKRMLAAVYCANKQKKNPTGVNERQMRPNVKEPKALKNTRRNVLQRLFHDHFNLAQSV